MNHRVYAYGRGFGLPSMARSGARQWVGAVPARVPNPSGGKVAIAALVAGVVLVGVMEAAFSAANKAIPEK